MSRLLAIVVAAFLVPSCYEGGDVLAGLAERNPEDKGPTVVWNVRARPIPDIPFPNDIATRTDPSSPTGRRVNVSRQATTEHERTMRTLLNRLDGFGTYAPIWLRFAGRLDIADIFARHHDSQTDNDAVYLLNIDPESPVFGQAVPLDLGSGPPHFGGSRFPLQTETSEEFPEYFAMDPRREAGNLLFETYDEDSNDNGMLDAGEDSDGDGILDRPNLWGRVLDDEELMDPYRHLLSCYDLESDTLIVRPIFGLQQLSRYAVIITRAATGLESGSPVRSPFPAIHHLQQTEALLPLVNDDLLANLGLDIEDVAFAWTFTTQSISKDFETIRAGLHGLGAMSYLAKEFPAQLAAVGVLASSPNSKNPYILAASTLVEILNEPTLLAVLDIAQVSADELVAQYQEFVDYFIFAEIDAPDFIHPEDGAFRLTWPNGRAEYEHQSIYINCAIPKPHGNHRPPFPVVMYSHGSGSTRLEILGYAAGLAEFGFAACAIDAYGHGLAADEGIRAIADAIVSKLDQDLSAMLDMVFTGRARDLNGDGIADSGGDFWSANMVHTRDMLRQSVVDYFQVLRVLRNFGHTIMPVDIDGDGRQELAGDFNADGVVDLGGHRDYFMMGQSLGGMVTAVTGAVEPSYTAIAPVVAGAGLTDIAVRSLQPGMLEAIYLVVFGTLVFAEPLGDGRYRLAFDALDVLSERRPKIAEIPEAGCDPCERIAVGDRVVLENLHNREFSELVVANSSGFRLTVKSDRGDPLEVRLYRPGAVEPYRVINRYAQDTTFGRRQLAAGEPLTALQNGFGLRRGTPEMRRLLAIAQMIVDPADPANYAPFYHQPLTLMPDGPSPVSVLNVTSIGDMRVPVNTGVALGRLAGLVGQESSPVFGVSEDQLLLDTWVVEGLEQTRRFSGSLCHYNPNPILFDIDDAAGDVPVAPGEPAESRPRLLRVNEPPECRGVIRPAHCADCESRVPLRATVQKAWGVSGQRFLYQNSTGAHSFRLPDPTQAFDTARYQIRQIAWYFKTRGKSIVDHPCLAVPDGCDFVTP